MQYVRSLCIIRRTVQYSCTYCYTYRIELSEMNSLKYESYSRSEERIFLVGGGARGHLSRESGDAVDAVLAYFFFFRRFHPSHTLRCVFQPFVRQSRPQKDTFWHPLQRLGTSNSVLQ